LRNLLWIDEFIRSIKNYIFLRKEDNVMIIIPNQVYSLNKTGFKVLEFLFSGGKIRDIEKFIDDKKKEELFYFFCDLRAILTGCLKENEKRKTINYLEYSEDFFRYPVISEVAVNYRCNLNCKFCYAGSQNKDKGLSTKDIKKILKKIRYQAKVPFVSFTGGEPLLRKDIFELISFAQKIDLKTNLITNGTLITVEVAEKLKRAGLESAQVSLEGPEKVHNEITGVRGAFEKTIRGIKELKEKGIRVHTNTTLNKMNIPYVFELIDIIKSIGLDKFSMNLLIPCGSAYKNKDIWVKYSEIGEVIKKVKNYSNKKGLKFIWYSPLPFCIFNPVKEGLGGKGCAALKGLLSVDPQGNIIPCSSFFEPVGNLLKEDFEKIWFSEKAQFYRKREFAGEKCKKCELFEKCTGACVLYFRKIGYEEIKRRI